MNKMKSILGLYAMAMSLSLKSRTHHWDEPTKEDKEEKKRRLAKAEIERNKANGLKEFFYYGNSVWAINQKVADKKAKRLNYI
jgi:hypothetical protein